MSTDQVRIRKIYLDILANHWGHTTYADVDDAATRKQLAEIVDDLVSAMVDETWIAEYMNVTLESSRVARTRWKGQFPEPVSIGKEWARGEVEAFLQTRTTHTFRGTQPRTRPGSE